MTPSTAGAMKEDDEFLDAHISTFSGDANQILPAINRGLLRTREGSHKRRLMPIGD